MPMTSAKACSWLGLAIGTAAATATSQQGAACVAFLPALQAKGLGLGITGPAIRCPGHVTQPLQSNSLAHEGQLEHIAKPLHLQAEARQDRSQADLLVAPTSDHGGHSGRSNVQLAAPCLAARLVYRTPASSTECSAGTHGRRSPQQGACHQRGSDCGVAEVPPWLQACQHPGPWHHQGRPESAWPPCLAPLFGAFLGCGAGLAPCPCPAPGSCP